MSWLLAQRLRHRVRACASLIAALAVAAPLTAQTGRGLIWSVEKDGKTGWLVGSMHALTAADYPLPASFTTAFSRADTVIEEADLEAAGSPELMLAVASKGMYRDGQTLETVLPPATYALLRDRSSKAGLPVEMVRMMKPWMAAITLSAMEIQRAGLDPQQGVDAFYRRQVTATGKQFQALETPEQQMDFLANLAPDVQVAQLTESLQDGEAAGTQLRGLAAAWRTGDTAAIEREVMKSRSESPAVYEAVVAGRNRTWLPRLETCLTTRSCFIVVGAAHMVGPDGIVALLRQRGYKVTQQ